MHTPPGQASPGPIENTSEHYRDLRVLVVRDHWLGCTGLAASNALLRLGVNTNYVSEVESVPKWTSLPLRILGRAIRREAVKDFNRVLVSLARQMRPHILLVFKGAYVFAESLHAIRKLGTVTLNFYTDVSFHCFGPYLPNAVKQYGWVFTSKSFGVRDLKGMGVTACSYLPHGFDSDLHRPRVPSPRESDEYAADVAFFGSWSPGKARTLEELILLRPSLDLRIWGDRWERLDRGSPLQRFVKFRALPGVDYATAIGCSKIALCLLHVAVAGASSGDLITTRTFEFPACGSAMLHKRTADLLEIFTEDVNCACFDSTEELAAKIDALLKDPERRESIARKGRELVEYGHSWDHRVRTILDHYYASGTATCSYLRHTTVTSPSSRQPGKGQRGRGAAHGRATGCPVPLPRYRPRRRNREM
jgi:glycosyltransferase involved in cell wall biosynthesis